MRIAIVRLTSLGDVVHTLPLAAAVRCERPGDEIVWIAEEHEQALLVGNPCVDRVVVAPLRRWRTQSLRGAVREVVRELGAFVSRLRAAAIDVTIDVQGWWHKTSPIVVLTRAPCRIGFSRGYARDALSPLFTTVRVTPPPEAKHVVDQNLALLGPLGIVRPVARFLLPSWPDAEARVSRWLADRGLGAGEFIVLLPSSRGRKKRWPAALFGDLLGELRRATGRPIVVAGGPEEASLLATVARASDSGIVYAAPPISDLARLVARARLVVGNDTGPLHLAAAAGVPTLGLFGPTSGIRNGPYGPTGRFIQSATGRMADIPVDLVLDTALEMLGRSA